MATKVFQKISGGISSVGGLVSSIFLSPPTYVWGLCGLAIAATGIGLMINNTWVQSKPNEWLLVIRDGKLIKSGIGLKTMVGFYDNVVIFPSKVEKVQFTVDNITKQMQGVAITGFGFWTVNRQGQGPFDCYKYMQGGDPNGNFQAMCNSALRNLIANSNLTEIMNNRNLLRDKMKQELGGQFKKWGIWLESVELKQVKICSQKIFNDLQAESRQEARLKAEQIQITSNQKMNESRQLSELRTATMNEGNATSKQETRNNEQLKRRKQQSNFEDAKTELQIQRLEREKNFEISRLKNQLQKEQERLSNSQKLKDLEQQFTLGYARKTIQIDKLYTQKTMKKYQIDAMERIYNKLGVKQIRVNQFVGNTESSLANLLPTMGFGMQQLKKNE